MQIATIIEEAPTTEPTERSNSPPIISMPIGERDDAEIGGGVEPVGRAERRQKAVLTRHDGEESEDERAPETTPPASGRWRARASSGAVRRLAARRLDCASPSPFAPQRRFTTASRALSPSRSISSRSRSGSCRRPSRILSMLFLSTMLGPVATGPTGARPYLA